MRKAFLAYQKPEISGQFTAHGNEYNERDKDCPEYDVTLIAHGYLANAEFPSRTGEVHAEKIRGDDDKKKLPHGFSLHSFKNVFQDE